jgi:hypothetical protein
MNAIRILLTEAIDYAGLFPPAGLDMASAVRNYAEYRSSRDAWALGKFVVPVNRLHEFETAAAAYLHCDTGAEAWQLSVLAGPDLSSDLAALAEFNRRHLGAVVAASIEVRAASARAIGDIMRRLPANLQAFVEIPIDPDPHELLTTIARLGGRAKVRTGGVTGDAFPAAADLLRFVKGSIQSGVPFKATAGLHHPLRAEYRLTYAADSASAAMFGFLNLLLATGFLRSGMEDSLAAGALEEGSPGAFQLEGEGISWRGHRLDGQALRLLRRESMISFGSCSFTEPLSDLDALRLLPRTQPA